MSRREQSSRAVLLLSAIAFGGISGPSLAGLPAGLPVVCPGVGETGRGLDMALNPYAQYLRDACGLRPPGKPWSGLGSGGWLGPLDSGTNINVITGDQSAPYFTQSESTVWSGGDGNTIVVLYNDDSNSNGLMSISYSLDRGATFTRIRPSPFEQGHNSLGDPILVYNAKLQTWFGGSLVADFEGCGGIPAVGIGLWSSLNGIDWTPGACVHGARIPGDDRESMWVDNNPGSPYYGRMYISWNTFNFAGGASLSASYSDDGTTWSDPVLLASTFLRNVQLTGSPGMDGTVFLAALDEEGGGIGSRRNYMYRSIDGGVSWTSVAMGPDFPGAGDTVCSDNPYFAIVSPIWRQTGYGQPAVGPNGVVHYVYAGQGLNAGDFADIYYQRSTDNGLTWSDPIVLNGDQAPGGTQEQWMPSLSVNAAGLVQAAWYDRRNTAANYEYEYWGRRSDDNGATWHDDEPISDQLIPQPEPPPDNPCYAGDYNYHSAYVDISYLTWTDGRNPVSGHFQQDVYFDLRPRQ